ncbi:MAG: GFA family protein, partial [Methyloligellaceae bacterium]
MRTGRCQCGGVQFECPDEPLEIYVCHCRECQKQSSSAFGISYITQWSGLRVVKGEPAHWTRSTNSGGTLQCAFCPSCGSRVWHRPDNAGDIVSVKGGALDEPVDIANATYLWTDRKLPGVCIPDGVKTFAGEPD